MGSFCLTFQSSSFSSHASCCLSPCRFSTTSIAMDTLSVRQNSTFSMAKAYRSLKLKRLFMRSSAEGHMPAFATADICDENEQLLENGDLRSLYPVFKIYGRSEAFFGPTVTIKVFEENYLVNELLLTKGDGRVLVIDGGRSMRRAMIGGELAHLAKTMGWSGILVNGCIRDVNEINGCDIGVRALASCPWRPGKNIFGETHLPVHIGGTIIRDGEWLYADNDGILISKTELSITPYKTKVN